MRVEDHSERTLELSGWPVHLTTWRLGAVWHSRADNVSPGATLSRAHAGTKDEAESQAIDRARELLGRTQRRAV